MNLAGRPVAAFDPEGLIFAVGINSESVKLYDLRSFDKGPFSSFKFSGTYYSSPASASAKNEYSIFSDTVEKDVECRGILKCLIFLVGIVTIGIVSRFQTHPNLPPAWWLLTVLLLSLAVQFKLSSRD